MAPFTAHRNHDWHIARIRCRRNTDIYLEHARNQSGRRSGIENLRIEAADLYRYTGATGIGKGALAGLPSTPGSVVWPAPGANRETIDPLLAALERCRALAFCRAPFSIRINA